jgi:hypothetical protein
VASVSPAGVGAGVDCDRSALATRGLDDTLPFSFTVLCVQDSRLWAGEDGVATDDETDDDCAGWPCVLLSTGCRWLEVSGASRKTLCTHWIARETQCEHGSFRSHFIFRRLHSRHENAGLRRRRGLSIGGVLELEEADIGGAALGRKKLDVLCRRRAPGGFSGRLAVTTAI